MYQTRAARTPTWATPVKKVATELKKDDLKSKAVPDSIKGSSAPVIAAVGAKTMAMEVAFNINSVKHTLAAGEFGPSMTLAKFIREVACLPGTKVSCNEGGCGACIVTVKKFPEDTARSLNSCLTPVLACDGWSITTIEGLGGKTAGYHPIQAKLAAEGGSQCGYCSPGMVMQLHSWLEEHPNSTQLEIDNILDGNICRCTGYRPILTAFKAFATDNSDGKLVTDIEDLKLCKSTGKACPGSGSCHSASSTCHSSAITEVGDFVWHDPTTVQELQDILKGLDNNTKYRLVSGDTAKGVYKNDGPFDVYINLNKIVELHTTSLEAGVVLGANVKITDAINLLETANDEVYVGVANHMKKIASYGIRNQGSLAGNLMIKNAHNDFPSDVFLSLETAGAMANIVSADGVKTSVSIGELPYTNMDKKILTTITIPMNEKVTLKKKTLNNLWLQSTPKTATASGGQVWKYKSYKIMPRSTNAHAYVNAGFKALIDTEDNCKIIGKPRLVFGGINETFVHASATEEFLMDRNMNDHDMFLEAMAMLAEELVPDDDPSLAAPLYRKQLAMGLFYKFYLYVLGDMASAEVRSGCADLNRGLSSGVQAWDTDESQWPISKPVEKYEAKIQCAGEATYVNDIPASQGELHAAFVLTSRANCDIAAVDAAAALALPGVVSYVDAKDIPGLNNWTLMPTSEPLFATTRSEYAGQQVGVIVAESRELAVEAAKLIKITYSNEGAVITDLEESMKNPDNVALAAPAITYGEVDAAMDASDSQVSGRFKMGSQYHFHMETHVCIAKPADDGFDIELPTQFIDFSALVLSKVMNIDVNSINLSVKRLGGAYGAKIFMQNAAMCASTVAANKLGRPVRLWMNLEDNMRMLGKRNPYLFDYQIGFDKNRRITAVKADIYSDGGWNMNGSDAYTACLFGQSCYNIPALSFSPYGVTTHTQAHTATRAPGMVNGHAMLEHMLEHAAAEMMINPMELRMNNLMTEKSPVLPPPATLDTECIIEDIVNQLKISSDFDNRVQAASTFNQANKWKKRGISMVPMRFPHEVKGYMGRLNCLISVYGADGTISVATSGIEMGQGLNTKVHQVVAKELGVDMALIKIKPANYFISPNTLTTGGSCGSELSCAAAVKACEVMNANLAPIKASLGPDATWMDIVQGALANNVDLCAMAPLMVDTEEKISGYSVWGAVVTEVEVDILTGEMFIVRTDLIEDAGLSTSPQVDIGQVEGAFAMGLGLWTSEEIKFDPTTGDLLTKNTWEYKPPAAKDIPQEFNVTLLKNARNPLGVFSSKATGEPALLLSISVLFAIKNSLTACRADAGLSGWWKLDGPATVEKIHQHTGISPDMFTF